MRTTSQRQGFTLVELLVVIGIIAVLISILLPSLAAARRSAVAISCQANLRSIGQGLFIYSSDFKKLPWGKNFVWDAWGSNPMNWASTVHAVLGGGTYHSGAYPTPYWENNALLKIFQCPGSQIIDNFVSGGQRNYPNLHYTATFRAMPCAYPGWGLNCDAYTASEYPPYGKQWTQRNIETIQDSSSVALVWDGAQIENGPNQGSKQWTAQSINENHAGMLGYAPWAVYDPNIKSYGGNPFDYQIPIPIGDKWNTYWNYVGLNGKLQHLYQNVDPSDGYYLTPGVIHQNSVGFADMSVCSLRYRHGQNDIMNVLFADGHVSPVRLDESNWRMFCMNYR